MPKSHDPYECYEIAPGMLYFERESSLLARRADFPHHLNAPWLEALAVQSGLSELIKFPVSTSAH